NPLLAPFLVTLEVELGSLVTTGQHAAFTLARAKQTGILGFVWQAGVGSVFVGSGLAAIGAAVAYAVASRITPVESDALAADRDDELDAALLRTIARYRDAPIADRIYVAAKLRSDPLTRLLAGLPGDFGRVLDVGAGRGQFGLFLSELGRSTEVRGFDSDPRKIAVAQVAAAAAAHFEVQAALGFAARDVDTLLLADVLHYLPLAEQDELLRRAALCVKRGRILIRELDAEPVGRSAVTRVLEWLAMISGYNRGGAGRHYRPASELVAQLTRTGFSCEVQGASQGTPFGNVLIIATRA
ncbi:MAG TPA: class I SAM-dependent methyltransferase, partial [Polyangiaceae bacterium]